MAVKVREKNGVWWIRVDHKGKRVSRLVGPGREGKRAALAAAEQIMVRLALGALAPPAHEAAVQIQARPALPEAIPRREFFIHRPSPSAVKPRPPANPCYFVYVLLLEDQQVYVGETSRLEGRLREHFHGRGAGITRIFRPVQVLSAIPVPSHSEARQIEDSVQETLGCWGGRWCSVTRPPSESARLALTLVQRATPEVSIQRLSGHPPT